jgi:signal transduction histidine kinase
LTLQTVARLLAPTARAHSVEIEVEPVPSETRIRVSEADLQHVLLNLSLNGIQASKPGGRIRLGAESGDPVRIHVIDEGCGIPPEDQKRIFEPFFSIRSGGTGLGLFLSLNFARQWGGDIQVSSAPGAGSTFVVTIPSVAAGVH